MGRVHDEKLVLNGRRFRTRGLFSVPPYGCVNASHAQWGRLPVT